MEKDPLIKESLVIQFADASDYKLLDSLIAKGVELYSLGLGETNKEGVKPLYYAIQSGDLNKLKLAQHLYSFAYKDAGEMLSAKWYLKKIKTKDPEVNNLLRISSSILMLI